MTAFRSSEESPTGEEIPQFPIEFTEYIEAEEIDLLSKALEHAGGIQTKAAKLLRINLRSFRYLLQKYNLR